MDAKTKIDVLMREHESVREIILKTESNFNKVGFVLLAALSTFAGFLFTKDTTQIMNDWGYLILMIVFQLLVFCGYYAFMFGRGWNLTVGYDRWLEKKINKLLEDDCILLESVVTQRFAKTDGKSIFAFSLTFFGILIFLIFSAILYGLISTIYTKFKHDSLEFIVACCVFALDILVLVFAVLTYKNNESSRIFRLIMKSEYGKEFLTENSNDAAKEKQPR